MKPLPPDPSGDDWFPVRGGTAPYSYLERIAICIHEGGLSEREATQLATLEHQRIGAGSYVPNRVPGESSPRR